MTDFKSSAQIKDESDKLSAEVMGSSETFTLEDEKKVLRKIDLVILPFVCLVTSS